jgi:hypothetical protein
MKLSMNSCACWHTMGGMVKSPSDPRVVKNDMTYRCHTGTQAHGAEQSVKEGSCSVDVRNVWRL